MLLLGLCEPVVDPETEEAERVPEERDREEDRSSKDRPVHHRGQPSWLCVDQSQQRRRARLDAVAGALCFRQTEDPCAPMTGYRSLCTRTLQELALSAP